MQNKAANKGCKGAQSGSNCVIWTGQPIPALGIEQGDTMSEIVCTLATQIVDLSAPLDLTSVSIQCLIDNLGASEPATRTVASLLQVVIDSNCNLYQMLQAAIATINNETPVLTLNLGCLATYDVYGNPLPYTEASVLQTLLNTACGTQTTLNALSGTVTALQASVSALQAVKPYTEPTLTSCLYSGRQTSDALQVTAAAVCTYMSQVGQSTDISTAMAQLPTAFTQIYGLKSGWILNPSNLAQSYNNLAIVVADLYNQVTTINTTCCQINCDDVIVDFDIKLSSDRTMATLYFAAKTSIPPGFTQVNPLGSKLVITDSLGDEYDTYINVLAQATNPDGITIDLNSSSIDPSADYTFGMSVSLTNGTLTCTKCISHTVTYKDTCAYCQISVTSPGGTPIPGDMVVVIYTSPGNSNTQSATIYSGTTQVIPSTAQISSLIVYGTAQYTSGCTLPSPTTPTCYELSWAFSKSSGGNDGVFTDANFISMSVMGISYPVNCCGSSGDCSQCYKTVFGNFLPVTQGLMGPITLAYTGSSNIQSYKAYFLTTAAIAATIEGYIGDASNPNNAGDGFDGGAYFKPISVASSNCPVIGGGGSGQSA